VGNHELNHGAIVQILLELNRAKLWEIEPIFGLRLTMVTVMTKWTVILSLLLPLSGMFLMKAVYHEFNIHIMFVCLFVFFLSIASAKCVSHVCSSHANLFLFTSICEMSK